MISGDNGKSWIKSGDMERVVSMWESSIVEFNNGMLYSLMRTRTGYQYESFSKDKGISWSEPKKSRFKSPCACAILYRLRNGHIILVWNNTLPQEKLASNLNLPRSPLDVALSKDDGKTWKIKTVKTTNYQLTTRIKKYQLSNHAVCQLANGNILVAIASNGPVYRAIFNEAWINE